jgi:hypothetical protein
MNYLREVLDAETCKILAVGGLSAVVTVSNASALVSLVTGIGICLFVWLKLWRAYQRKD